MKFFKNPRGSEAKRKFGADFVKLKIAPLLVAVLLAVNPLALCASASVWEGYADVGYVYWGSTDGVGYQKSNNILLPTTGYSIFEEVNQRTSNGMRVNLGDAEFSSPVSIYISAYYRNSHTGATITEVGDPWDIDNYEIKYTVGTNTEHRVKPEYIAVFTPTDEMHYVGTGMTFVAKVDASEAMPAKDIVVRVPNECGWKRTGANSYKGQWFYTSVRVIGAETSAELDALDGMASEIAKQNETLEAMKGEIVALLQQIYITTGDMEIAMSQTKSLVNSIVGFVDGLEGQLGEANSNLSNIYSLMSGFFTQISKLIKDNHDAMSGQINDFAMMVEGRLHDIYMELSGQGGSGDAIDDTNEKVEQGSSVMDGLNEMEKIEVDDAVGNLYTPNGETEEFASVLSSFFNNSLVMTMLMVSLSMSFVAYVLYGKR